MTEYLLDDAGQSMCYTSVRVAEEGRQGAPKFSISADQIKLLMACRFTKRKMGEILHVSKRTIERRIKEFNLTSHWYSVISDAELDELIRTSLQHNRRVGANAVKVRLENSGIYVQRERVRHAMHRVDSAGVALRRQRAVRRRTYAVNGPNSLWHMDGNHKLIRWRIVIHGAVDGYSRLITFMTAATNNRASTVFASFQDAVKDYGVPSRMRCDRGGENRLVYRFMEETQGTGRGSAIVGRSVHNQRIERLWLDLWNGVTNTFYDFFMTMERDRILDPNSEEQMFALHYIYMPRLQQAISKFVLQWNNHKLRTENATPLQMFVQRSLELYQSTSVAARGIFSPALSQTQTASEEENGMEILHTNTDIDIPETMGHLSQEQLDDLKGRVDNSTELESADMGLNKYFKALDFMSENIVI